MTVDRLLPGLDGLSLIQCLRQRGISSPVLVLSALSDVEERVRGLRSGGDDYLTSRSRSAAAAHKTASGISGSESRAARNSQWPMRA